MEALNMLWRLAAPGITAAILAVPLAAFACKGAPGDGSDEYTICPEH